MICAPRTRADWLRATIAAGCIAGLLLSPHLWLRSRTFPFSPVWVVFLPFTPPWDWVAYAALLGSLLWCAVARRPRVPIAVFLVLALVFALQDQSRWQPWFYQYIIMLLAIMLAPAKQEDAALNTCRLVIAGIYIWSGIAKLNPGFLHDTFPWMIQPFSGAFAILPERLVRASAFIVPLFECGLGVGLLSRRWRKAALAAGVAMHIVILAAIGPWGLHYNSVVWPWNVAMIAFLVILFAPPERVSTREILWTTRSFEKRASDKLPFHKVAFALILLAPALRPFNLWDSYLSFALYSGNQDTANIYLNDATFERLPEAVQDHVYEEGPNLNSLSIREWSFAELNVPPYSEPRVFRGIARWICSATGDPEDVRLTVQTKFALVASHREYSQTCSNLRSRE